MPERAMSLPVESGGNLSYHSMLDMADIEFHSDPLPLSVLMVEDDSTFVKIVQYHLKKYTGRTFHLVWRDSIEAALTELRQNTAFDIILTDFSFPSSNGLEFCLNLNQMGITVPIVFITGLRDVKLAVEAMKLGVEDFIVKEDLNEAMLPRTILSILERCYTRHQMLTVERRMKMAESRAQAIREIVVTLCHEFNNPLAAIKISAELLHRSLTGDRQLHLMENFGKSFDHIEAEIKRLRDINFEKIDFHHADSASPNKA
jgi:FixJ family two-component response regulator